MEELESLNATLSSLVGLNVATQSITLLTTEPEYTAAMLAYMQAELLLKRLGQLIQADGVRLVD